MADLVTNPTLSTDTVEALIQKYNEPTWLAEERRAALRTYEATPFPTRRDEVWRYTQLERFSLDGLEPVGAPKDRNVSERIRMRIEDSDAEGILVHKGNEIVHRDSKISEEGVIFTDLRTALREHEDLVREHLFSVINAQQTKYTALNSAFWENGTFVYVPRNVEVSLPLGAFNSADAGGITAPRTLIILEANAKATFIDEYTSEEFGERLFVFRRRRDHLGRRREAPLCQPAKLEPFGRPPEQDSRERRAQQPLGITDRFARRGRSQGRSRVRLVRSWLRIRDAGALLCG